jgi:hypothetical protein
MGRIVGMGSSQGTYHEDDTPSLHVSSRLTGRPRGRDDPEGAPPRAGRRRPHPLAWYDDGYLAVEGKVFDVGIQTGRALRALRAGTPASRSGPSDTQDNGNGSLMRVAGGVAGVRDGVEAIPSRWRERLRGRELCDPLIDALLARG